MRWPQKKMRNPDLQRYNMLDRRAVSSSVHVLGTSSGPAHEAGIFGCQEKLHQKYTMPTLQEIKAFAQAEGFEIRTCGHFASSLVPLVKNCELCEDTGFYFLAQETAWPPAAIEMMMADRARRDEIAAAAKAASASMHHARGQNDFAGRERGLNEVNQQLMKIWTAAQGARIE